MLGPPQALAAADRLDAAPVAQGDLGGGPYLAAHRAVESEQRVVLLQPPPSTFVRSSAASDSLAPTIRQLRKPPSQAAIAIASSTSVVCRTREPEIDPALVGAPEILDQIPVEWGERILVRWLNKASCARNGPLLYARVIIGKISHGTSPRYDG